MFGTILSILSPLFSVLGKIFVSFSNEEIAKVNADAQVETASIQGMAAVEQRWSFTAMMIPVLVSPFALYQLKAVAWDKVVGPMLGYASVTDPLTGDLQTAYWVIISGLFLHAWINK